MQIVIAYTNSDTLVPKLKVFSNKELARRDLKNYIAYLDNEDAQIISDEEIDEFLQDLNTKRPIWETLYRNDYEVVATGLLVGGNNE